MEPPETSSTASSQPTISASRGPTLAEWEAHRKCFIQLYVLEDKSLPEVQTEMASLYGFHATERQYKRKISDWKLDKNIKSADMRVMLRKQLKRKLEDGKESDFSVNGRPVPPAKMSRFVQRKNLSQEIILEEQMQTPAYIICSTPAGTKDDQVDNIGLSGDLTTPKMDIESSAGVHGALEELLGSSSDNSSGQESTPVERPVTGSLTTDSSTISNSTELDAIANFATRMTCFLWDEPIWVHDDVEGAADPVSGQNVVPERPDGCPVSNFLRTDQAFDINGPNFLPSNTTCLTLHISYKTREEIWRNFVTCGARIFARMAFV